MWRDVRTTERETERNRYQPHRMLQDHRPVLGRDGEGKINPFRSIPKWPPSVTTTNECVCVRVYEKTNRTDPLSIAFEAWGHIK